MDTTVNHFTPVALRVRGNNNLQLESVVATYGGSLAPKKIKEGDSFEPSCGFSDHFKDRKGAAHQTRYSKLMC